MASLRRPLVLVNARLIDPASGRDETGGLLVIDGRIVEIGPWVNGEGLPDEAEIVDARAIAWRRASSTCACSCASPARSIWRPSPAAPGRRRPAGSPAWSACPTPTRSIDDVAVVEFIARRARETRLAKVYCYAAVTKGLEGRDLVEMGLLAESGALAFTDGLKAVADALVMRRALSLCPRLRPPDHPASRGAAASPRAAMMNEGEIATRLGLSGIPPAAEVMMIERDLHLVAMTGARYHVAHVSTAAAIEAIRGAKARGLPVTCDTAPALFRAERDRGRRLPHLRQAVAAAAQRGRPPGHRRGGRRRHDRLRRQRPCAP